MAKGKMKTIDGEQYIKVSELPSIERLAEHCHKQWSGWMKYLFGKCNECIDGTYEIPSWAVDRWKRQMNTEYKDLPEEEKESDRGEAQAIHALIVGEES